MKIKDEILLKVVAHLDYRNKGAVAFGESHFRALDLDDLLVPAVCDSLSECRDQSDLNKLISINNFVKVLEPRLSALIESGALRATRVVKKNPVTLKIRDEYARRRVEMEELELPFLERMKLYTKSTEEGKALLRSAYESTCVKECSFRPKLSSKAECLRRPERVETRLNKLVTKAKMVQTFSEGSDGTDVASGSASSRNSEPVESRTRPIGGKSLEALANATFKNSLRSMDAKKPQSSSGTSSAKFSEQTPDSSTKPSWVPTAPTTCLDEGIQCNLTREQRDPTWLGAQRTLIEPRGEERHTEAQPPRIQRVNCSFPASDTPPVISSEPIGEHRKQLRGRPRLIIKTQREIEDAVKSASLFLAANYPHILRDEQRNIDTRPPWKESLML